MHFLDIQILPNATANKLTLDNINISPVIPCGQERLPGYEHLFIVPTKSVATMIFYKKKSTISNHLGKLISQFSPSTTNDNLNTENVNADNNPNLKKIWIPLPYIGKHGTRLLVRTALSANNTPSKITMQNHH